MNNKDFFCDICNKNYKSYSSLWNHKKKYHIEIKNEIIINNKKIICEYCNKNFNTRSAKCLHKKKCNEKNKFIEKENEELKMVQLKKELEEIKLKTKIEKAKKEFINITQNITNNNNINSHNKIQNITINNIGKENIDALMISGLDDLTKMDEHYVIGEVLRKLNFNPKVPENHSFCSTSLEGKYFTVVEDNNIMKRNKKDFCNVLIKNVLETIPDYFFYPHDKNTEENKQIIDDIIYKVKKGLKDTKFVLATNERINEVSYNHREMAINTWKNTKEKLEEEIIDDGEPTFSCNICNKFSCDEFDEYMVHKRKCKNSVLECCRCYKFKTFDDKEYNQHTKECKKNPEYDSSDSEDD